MFIVATLGGLGSFLSVIGIFERDHSPLTGWDLISCAQVPGETSWCFWFQCYTARSYVQCQMQDISVSLAIVCCWFIFCKCVISQNCTRWGLELLSVPRGCKKVVGWFRCSSSKVTDIVCASGLRLRLRWVCNPQSRALYSYHDSRPWNKVPRRLVRVGAAS